MLIQRREAIVLRIAVRGVRDRGTRGEVVYPMELRLVRSFVEAAEQEVHGVGVSGAQRFGELAADEGGDFIGA